MRRNGEKGSRDMAWASLLGPSVGVNVPAAETSWKWGSQQNRDSFLLCCWKLLILKENLGASMVSMRGARVLHKVLAPRGACGIWRKRWTLPNKPDWEKFLHTRPIKNQKTWACLLCTAVKGREQAGRSWTCQGNIVNKFPVSSVRL